MQEIRFDGQVAIVTGAGLGLGRAHALALAARGARVVVNDLGSAIDGTGGSQSPAQQVVDTIHEAGGEALANSADVTRPEQVEAMVAAAMARWGRVDILINNAGVLRDKSFAKLSLDDFRFVMEVHVMGTVHCCKAVWDIMRAQNYGRIVMTSSPSGLFGNYGQANYAAAKMAVIGLMHTLQIEGGKHNIRVNALAPAAATRMTEGLLPPELAQQLSPEAVTAGLLTLADADAPTNVILMTAAGHYARCRIVESEGLLLHGDSIGPEAIRAAWDQVEDTGQQRAYANSPEQAVRLMARLAEAQGKPHAP